MTRLSRGCRNVLIRKPNIRGYFPQHGHIDPVGPTFIFRTLFLWLLSLTIRCFIGALPCMYSFSLLIASACSLTLKLSNSRISLSISVSMSLPSHRLRCLKLPQTPQSVGSIVVGTSLHAAHLRW